MNSKYKRLRDETVRSCRAVVKLVSGREGGEKEGREVHENKCPGNVVCFDGEVVNEEGQDGEDD